ncbi:MAG: hypothetical protein V1816_07075 [Pseudomonadota bacterium]
MLVRAVFLGPLGLKTGPDPVAFELPDGALYGALLAEIGRRFGAGFPKGVWDFQANVFKGAVLAVGVGRDLVDPETPLRDNEEIKFAPLLIGG